MIRFWWFHLRRALRTRFIASTRVEQTWIALVTVLLSVKPLIPRASRLALPISLPTGRRMMLADVSEVRVLHEVFLDKIYDVPALPKSARLILDLGSNAGAASEFFAARYPESHIEAYEADPQVAARARRNLRGLPVRMHTAAISDSTAEVELRRPVGLSWATSVFAEEGERFSVPGTTLDSIIGDRQVDILKIDIEGSEYAAIKACSRLRQVDLILGEFHPSAGIAADDFFGLMASFDLLSGGGEERATFVARRRDIG